MNDRSSRFTLAYLLSFLFVFSVLLASDYWFAYPHRRDRAATQAVGETLWRVSFEAVLDIVSQVATAGVITSAVSFGLQCLPVGYWQPGHWLLVIGISGTIGGFTELGFGVTPIPDVVVDRPIGANGRIPNTRVFYVTPSLVACALVTCVAARFVAAANSCSWCFAFCAMAVVRLVWLMFFLPPIANRLSLQMQFAITLAAQTGEFVVIAASTTRDSRHIMIDRDSLMGVACFLATTGVGITWCLDMMMRM